MAKKVAPNFEEQMYAKLRGELTALEKKNRVANYGFSSNFANRMSTNLLSADLMLGGGIIPGYWYTSFGVEQSAKSTFAMQIMMAALSQDIPNIHLFDFESSSGDSDYLMGQMKTNRLKLGLDSLYGIRKKDGTYAIPPRVDYYSDDVLEIFFDLESSYLRRLPDKFMSNNQWWYGFENDKHGKAMTEGKHDKRMYQQTGKLCVPASDGRMQSLIIVDSYSAMTPERLDDDDPKAGIAARARAFAENIDRVRGKLRRKRCTVVGVNQLRLRPMVQFGCFHGATRVNMADGSKKLIRDLVANRDPGPVLSYNPNTKAFEAKRIVNWFTNGTTETFLQFKCSGASNGNNFAQFKCTENHLLMGADGVLRRAGSYQVGDTLMHLVDRPRMSTDQQQLVLGMVLGDGWFKKSSAHPGFGFYHGPKQRKYTKYLEKSLAGFVSSAYDNAEAARTVELLSIYEPWFEAVFNEAKRSVAGRGYRLSPTLLRHIDARGLAVWFMDDASARGTIKMQSYTFEDCEALAHTLNNRLHTDLQVRRWKDSATKSGSGWGVRFGPKALRLIAPYVHPSMDKPCFQNLQLTVGGAVAVDGPTEAAPYAIPVVISEIGLREVRGRDQLKYDLEVQDNHLYCVDGVVVHNSPEYEPNGEALKFASACRVKMTPRVIPQWFDSTAKGQYMEEPSVDGGTDTYRFVHARTHKNKLASANQETWLRLWTEDTAKQGRGFDQVFDTYQYLRMTGQVTGTRKKMQLQVPGFEKAKSFDWLSFKTLMLGNKDQVTEVLRKQGVIKKGEAPFLLRNVLTKQMDSGQGMDLYVKARQAAKGKSSSDDED